MTPIYKCEILLLRPPRAAPCVLTYAVDKPVGKGSFVRIDSGYFKNGWGIVANPASDYEDDLHTATVGFPSRQERDQLRAALRDYEKTPEARLEEKVDDLARNVGAKLDDLEKQLEELKAEAVEAGTSILACDPISYTPPVESRPPKWRVEFLRSTRKPHRWQPARLGGDHSGGFGIAPLFDSKDEALDAIAKHQRKRAEAGAVADTYRVREVAA